MQTVTYPGMEPLDFSIKVERLHTRAIFCPPRVLCCRSCSWQMVPSACLHTISKLEPQHTAQGVYLQQSTAWTHLPLAKMHGKFPQMSEVCNAPLYR